MGVVFEFSGAGWYGEVWSKNGRWLWGAAVDLTERLECMSSSGFYTAAAAERSMRAFVKIKQEQDIDRWVAFAGRIPVSQPNK